MSLSALGEPQPLSVLIHNLPITTGTWFYIDALTSEVTAALKCFPRVVDTRNMSEDEIDKMEDAIRADGLEGFLSSDQLADVLSNLREQRADATDSDFLAAIEFTGSTTHSSWLTAAR